MGRLFGTDGVRGLANRELTPELALGLAAAAVRVLRDTGAVEAGRRPVAVLGRDTRASGEMLAAAVVAGLTSAGADVRDAGVLPTPGVAHLAEVVGADLGVVLSASHNPMPDNGIKFFQRGGHKLDDAAEDVLEQRLGQPWTRPVGADVGRLHAYPLGADRYVTHLLADLPAKLDGLTVVHDAAHGAASVVGPEALRRAGAAVVSIGAEPDGLNINEGCGSTHLERLQEAVLANGADVGIANDGDADRCLAVDHTGAVVDGDQILAVLALALREQGRLRGDAVAATVMSNLGFRLAMEREGVRVVETAVGDRYVLEAMREQGLTLGGEQSGHVLLLEHATTGDGMLTALHLLARVAATGRSLRELASVVERLPQVLVNISGVDQHGVAANGPLADAVRAVEADLGRTGRVLLRPSGTEPVVRVMVEAATADRAEAAAAQLAEVVRAELTVV